MPDVITPRLRGTRNTLRETQRKAPAYLDSAPDISNAQALLRTCAQTQTANESLTTERDERHGESFPSATPLTLHRENAPYETRNAERQPTSLGSSRTNNPKHREQATEINYTLLRWGRYYQNVNRRSMGFSTFQGSGSGRLPILSATDQLIRVWVELYLAGCDVRPGPAILPVTILATFGSGFCFTRSTLRLVPARRGHARGSTEGGSAGEAR